MKKTEVKLLAELLKNSKKSDREIAKTLGVSQPTVSRIRTKLQREGVIREYSILPDLTKLGFELLAITTASFTVERTEKFKERAQVWMKKYPCVLLSSRAQGMGKDAVLVSLHRDFTDYETFMIALKSDWADSAKDLESIIVSLKGFQAKPFSFRYLSELLDSSEQ
jgi:DNA-binding Lrp family transcriptional regulator